MDLGSVVRLCSYGDTVETRLRRPDPASNAHRIDVQLSDAWLAVRPSIIVGKIC